MWILSRLLPTYIHGLCDMMPASVGPGHSHAADSQPHVGTSQRTAPQFLRLTSNLFRHLDVIDQPRSHTGQTARSKRWQRACMTTESCRCACSCGAIPPTAQWQLDAPQSMHSTSAIRSPTTGHVHRGECQPQPTQIRIPADQPQEAALQFQRRSSNLFTHLDVTVCP
jgi:hypothetical protein